MNRHPVVRSVSARDLIIVMCLVGMPCPAWAASTAVLPRIRPLTINGRPLSQVLRGRAVPTGAAVLDGSVKQDTGQILGVALDAAGQPLVGHVVTLEGGSPRGGRFVRSVVATTTTDARGRFSFSGLRQGRYAVEVRRDAEIVATSDDVVLGEGGMTFIQMGGVGIASSTSGDRHGKGALFWTAVGAGIGGAVGLVTMAGADCQFAENLCPVRAIGAVSMGALIGLLVGAGR